MNDSDLKHLREQIIIALFSDDELLDKLVLKGGNALSLIHAIGERASVDLDFSMEDKFPDDFDAESRIQKALDKHFRTIDYQVFDVKFMEKPSKVSKDSPVWWGGYVVELKIIKLDEYLEIEKQAKKESKEPIAEIRKRALQMGGPSGKITYKIDISKNEDCSRKEQTTIDDITIYVYSLEMIVIEKFRAICQQMPDYKYGHPRARSRDFYDIYTVLENTDIDLESSFDDFKSVFEIKEVPIEWLWKIPDQKEFHEVDWQGVEDTTKNAEDYDFYFDYVVSLLDKLKTSWNM